MSSCTTSTSGEADRENAFKRTIDNLFKTKTPGDNVNECQCDLPLELDKHGTDRRLGIINFETKKFEKC